jgi:hypothetical protein
MRAPGFVVAAALVLLAGCVTTGGPPPSPLAATEADADGKSFAAPPGMGRLYILHGDIRDPVPFDYTSAPGATSPIGLLFALTMRAAQGTGPPPPEPLTGTGRYYLNDRLLGTMGQGHYMALDLPPGEYVLRFEYDLDRERPPAGVISVPVKEGALTFRKSMINATVRGETHPVFNTCPDDECQKRIASGQRIAADWP